MPDQQTPDAFVEVTTESRRRRHWSLRMGMSPGLRRPQLPGRTGYTLCGGYKSVDQERLTYELSLWRGSKPVTVADLPPCRSCDKSRQRRLDGRPS